MGTWMKAGINDKIEGQIKERDVLMGCTWGSVRNLIQGKLSQIYKGVTS